MPPSSDKKNRLRIGIDAHALGSGLGGNETYLRCLLLGLRSHPEHDYILYVSHRDAGKIEAMACCIPVIVGRNSALPEVCGEAAHYADVTSEQVLGSAILKLALNELERSGLSESGRKRARAFTLENLAAPTIGAWEKIAAERIGH